MSVNYQINAAQCTRTNRTHRVHYSLLCMLEAHSASVDRASLFIVHRMYWILGLRRVVNRTSINITANQSNRSVKMTNAPEHQCIITQPHVLIQLSSAPQATMVMITLNNQFIRTGQWLFVMQFVIVYSSEHPSNWCVC